MWRGGPGHDERPGAPLRPARADFPAPCLGQLSPPEVADHGGHAGDLLHHALAALGPRAGPPGSGGAGRYAAIGGSTFSGSRSGATSSTSSRAFWSWRGSGCFCSPRPWAASGAAIPARRRSGQTFSSWSSAGSRGPQCADAAASRALELCQVADAADQMGDLVVDRGWHRRGLGVLFHRCADTGARSGHPAGAPDGLRHDRASYRHHLCLWRLPARAGLHLHVPLAAHSGGDDGRGHTDRRLSRLARRAARQGPAPPLCGSGCG